MKFWKKIPPRNTLLELTIDNINTKTTLTQQTNKIMNWTLFENCLLTILEFLGEGNCEGTYKLMTLIFLVEKTNFIWNLIVLMDVMWKMLEKAFPLVSHQVNRQDVNTPKPNIMKK